MGVMLDCPDAKELSAFYAELLGKPVTYEADGMAMIGKEGAQPVLFQQVERLHGAALAGSGPPAAVPPRRARRGRRRGRGGRAALGATKLDGAHPGYRVFADPADKPFCLVMED